MSTSLLPAGALLDEIATAVQRHGRPLYALFTTYTFDAHLFASQFLPLLCGEYAEDEQKVGLLVVCDARMYTGHHLGPWVTTWPTSELFHPKVALLVFDDHTLLMAGSGNLTHAGQYQQIEVWGKQTWSRGGLPSSLSPLVSRLRGPLSRALLQLPKLRSNAFACSLEENFAQRLKRGRADEIVVVSPFFDARESAEADDLGFVEELVRAHRPKTVHLVIPVEAGTIESPHPRTQVDPRIFADMVGGLRLFGIDPADGARPLHAKVLAICRHDRARLLFGSANATLAGMDRRNVEAGWFVETTRSELFSWLRKQDLLRRPLDPGAVRPAAKPPRSLLAPRSPLQCARLDEVEETLTLVWRAPGKRPDAEVFYEGRVLSARNDVVRGFRLAQEWFVRTKAAGQGRLGFAPIEIERELAGARHGRRDVDASGASLLERLVAAPTVDDDDAPARRRGGSRRGRRGTQAENAPLHDRVRRLASAMAVARRHLEGGLPQRLATLSLLLQIARAHDPAAQDHDAGTRLWSYWVRAEVARVLGAAPRSSALREARRVAKRLLGERHVPSELRGTARLIRNGVAR